MYTQNVSLAICPLGMRFWLYRDLLWPWRKSRRVAYFMLLQKVAESLGSKTAPCCNLLLAGTILPQRNGSFSFHIFFYPILLSDSIKNFLSLSMILWSLLNMDARQQKLVLSVSVRNAVHYLPRKPDYETPINNLFPLISLCCPVPNTSTGKCAVSSATAWIRAICCLQSIAHSHHLTGCGLQAPVHKRTCLT